MNSFYKQSYFDKNRTDSRIKCFRPDGTCYAIVARSRWIELRDKKKLNDWLDGERASGVILQSE